MAEGYVDTILLDANRRSSEEVKGDNQSQQSIYTNKLGVGVKLNSGDRVSIHSGYISKRGAGADTIELQGKESGKFIKLRQLTKKKFQKQINPVDYFGINLPNCNYSQIAQDYGCIQHTYEDVTYPIKDNEAHFNISYYKTTNGEGYYHLPRRFDAWKTQFQDETDQGPGGDASNSRLRQWPYLMASSALMKEQQNQTTLGWTGGNNTEKAYKPLLYDCWKNGLCSFGTFPDMTNSPGIPGRVLQDNYYGGAYANRFRRCMADLHFYQEGCIDQFFLNSTQGGPQPEGGGEPYSEKDRLAMLWKKKNDGSRYTMYVKEVAYFSKRNPKKWFLPKVLHLGQENMGDENDQNNYTSSRHDYCANGADEPTEIHLEKRDIACSEYIKYTETKTLKVEPGNYSPANLSTELTNQLNKTEKQEFITAVVQKGKYPFGASPGAPMTPGLKLSGGEEANETSMINSLNNDWYDTNMNVGKQEVISTTTDATCFKTFNCATAVSVEAAAFDNFINDNSLIEGRATFSYDEAESTCNYLSSFQFIGVKRPELFEAGRKIAKTLGYRQIGTAEAGENSGNQAFTWNGTNVAPLPPTLPQKPFTTEAPQAAGAAHTGWSWKQMINPFIVRELNGSNPDKETNMYSAVVATSWNWNESNLKALKEFFDVQGKYPELFTGVQFHKGDYANRAPKVTEVTYKTGLTADNARFLHINEQDGPAENHGNMNWKNPLGEDFNQVSTANGNYNGTGGSDAIFFYFDKSRSEIASGGDTDDSLYYGLFQKETWANPYSGADEVVIAFTTKKIGGLAPEYYDGYTEDPATGIINGGIISAGQSRTIGYDIHFSAYGTSCINLYDGHLNGSLVSFTDKAPETSSVPIGIQPRETDGTTSKYVEPVHQYLTKRYLGAENPQLSFDTLSSKFNFQDLHTPERVGNIIAAGAAATLPISASTDDKVYFVNKRLLKKEFCPDMFPYADLVASKVTSTSGSGPTETTNGDPSNTTYTTFMNKNISSWSIMDTDCGIFIEDFGFDKDRLFDAQEYPTNKLKSVDWKDTLWNMLGFSYDQFHTSFSNQQLSRQTRINNTITTDNIGKPTTNADIEPADLGQYNTNIYGAQLRTNQIPTIYAAAWDATPAADEAQVGFTGIGKDYFPSATIQATSAQINAQNLPIKMRDPYYLVKSDIITNTQYLGSEDSGVALPIIAVINKEGGEGDFFFNQQGQTEFTITAPKVLTEVKTQILNPDGSTAILSDDTSIIYKVTKVNMASLNVAEQMMQKTKK